MIVELVAGLLLAQPVPEGPDFRATFRPEAVASLLDGKVAYLVASGGEPTPALAAAAVAFEEGLRRSGRSELIMNGASLGPVANLDDQSLVKRCEPLPVARVAVVRVFETPGEAPRAVVAIYDKRGAVQVAFTVQAGQPLAPGHPRDGATGRGVSSGVAQTVLQAGGGQALEEYDKNFLGFDEGTAVSHHGTILSWSTAYQGKYRRPLEGDEFYRIIGRDDLVTAYGANRTKRIGITVAGVAIVVAVPAIAFLTRSQRTCPSFPAAGWFECRSANQDADFRAAMISVGGAVVGTSVVIYGLAAVKLHPVDGAEARRLGDEYNQKLKGRLGLARAPSLERAPEATEFSVALLPVPGGGMVGLAVTF
jgi:hypothetical protein